MPRGSSKRAAALRTTNNEPSNPSRRDSHAIEWLIWGALFLTILAVAAAFFWTRFANRLEKPLVVAGDVPAFTLTNQLGTPISLTNFLGHVWVADVIFTRCPMSCEAMTRRMKALQQQLPANVKFASLTTDPGYDSPEILRQYAERHGSDSTRWHFLTGVKTNVYKLAVDGLKFAVLDKTEQKVTDNDLFIHSTTFALVDKRGRIRGWFEGTEENERKQLVAAVKHLQRER